MVFPKDTGGFFKRTPFGFQKDSFWSVKGLLLSCKRTRFGMQKDSFLNFELFSAVPAIVNFVNFEFWLIQNME